MEHLASIWTDAAEHLRALVLQAVDTLHHLLECGDDRTHLRAAVEILKLANVCNKRWPSRMLPPKGRSLANPKSTSRSAVRLQIC